MGKQTGYHLLSRMLFRYLPLSEAVTRTKTQLLYGPTFVRYLTVKFMGIESKIVVARGGEATRMGSYW